MNPSLMIKLSLGLTNPPLIWNMDSANLQCVFRQIASIIASESVIFVTEAWNQDHEQ